MSDEPCSAIICFAVRRTNDPHHLPVKLEIDLSVGEKTRLLPNLDRDRYLSLGCAGNIQLEI